jgi:hypothetical protein
MSVGHFHIPGDATRREYAAYIMVATNRTTRQRKVYVGKTGDNRAGCNPVISRAGNHLSFNPIHSQMRNYLEPDNPHDYDFDYFYSTFGCYVPPVESRDGINVINEMERQLNRMAEEAFGKTILLNPYRGTMRRTNALKTQRKAIATEERMELLSKLVQHVKEFLEKPPAK